MKYLFKHFLIISLLFIFVCNINGQIDDICAEAGFMPSLDPPLAQVPYIYGRINLSGFEPSAKLPIVTVTMVDGKQATNRFTISKTGNYCFKVKNRGGTLIIEINGVEATRRSLPSFGPAQVREDFEIFSSQPQNNYSPGVVSAKFSHPANPKTVELYKKATEAESKKNNSKTIEIYKEIVSLDPADFIAWAKLGILYFSEESFEKANEAFTKCVELKVEYTPAWINTGKMRIVQKQYAAAIEIFKYALELEPNSAKIYRLLGEAYLQNKQGTLGEDALKKAIELDPIGMAECHLLLGHLYELAKANQMATKEYKLFLTKVPDYKDKKKLEGFIAKNPE